MEPFEYSNHRLENAGGSVRGWPGEGLIGFCLSVCLSPAPLPWAAGLEGRRAPRGRQRLPRHPRLMGDTVKNHCWRLSPRALQQRGRPLAGPLSTRRAAISRGGRGLLSAQLPRGFQEWDCLGSKGQGGGGWEEGGSPRFPFPAEAGTRGMAPLRLPPAEAGLRDMRGVWLSGPPASQHQPWGALWGGETCRNDTGLLHVQLWFSSDIQCPKKGKA